MVLIKIAHIGDTFRLSVKPKVNPIKIAGIK